MNPNYTVLKNLSKIPGFGPHTTLKLLTSLGISPSSIYSKISPFKQELLLQAIAALRKSSTWTALNTFSCNFKIDKLLLKEKQDNINRYIANLSYRGGRLRLGYPVNGGRTRSNGKTAKKLKN